MTKFWLLACMILLSGHAALADDIEKLASFRDKQLAEEYSKTLSKCELKDDAIRNLQKIKNNLQEDYSEANFVLKWNIVSRSVKVVTDDIENAVSIAVPQKAATQTTSVFLKALLNTGKGASKNDSLIEDVKKIDTEKDANNKATAIAKFVVDKAVNDALSKINPVTKGLKAASDHVKNTTNLIHALDDYSRYQSEFAHSINSLEKNIMKFREKLKHEEHNLKQLQKYKAEVDNFIKDNYLSANSKAHTGKSLSPSPRKTTPLGHQQPTSKEKIPASQDEGSWGSKY